MSDKTDKKEAKPVIKTDHIEADDEETEETAPEKVPEKVPELDSVMVNVNVEDSGNVLQEKLGKLLQDKMDNLVGQPSGYIESLPEFVHRRLRALKNLQWQNSQLEAKFYQEVYSLECKYATMYSPFYEKRCQFITGKVEPTDEECDFPCEGDTEEEEMAAESNENVENENVENENPKVKVEDPKGIPEFWLTTFKNVAMIADMIQDHDEPVLKHLIDVVLKLNQTGPMGFNLEFHFEPNEFFTDSILVKEYEMKCEPEYKEPFAFDGPEIVKCRGCAIDWKKGKDVTVKTIKKKQKHKSRGSVRTVMKTVQNDSFFNFFNPPPMPEPGEPTSPETEALINADFEIGHFLKDRVIPRAVLYFTGEALTDYEDDDDDEDEEEEDDEEDEKGGENNDSDPDFKVDKKSKKHTPPPECKQQ